MSRKKQEDFIPVAYPIKRYIANNLNISFTQDFLLFLESNHRDDTFSESDGVLEPIKINELKTFFNKLQACYLYSISVTKIKEFEKFLENCNPNCIFIRVAHKITQSLISINFTMEPHKEFDLVDSRLFNFIAIDHREMIPPYMCSYAFPKTLKDISNSFAQSNIDTINKINELSLVKVDGKDYLQRDFDIIDIINVFIKKVNPQQITRCSFPVIDVMLEFKRHGFFEDKTLKRSEADAISLIRFIMYIEKITSERRTYDEISSEKEYNEFIEKLLPFDSESIVYNQEITADMLGTLQMRRSTGKCTASDAALNNGRIKNEKYYRHNLVIFESMLIAMFITEDKEDENYKRLCAILEHAIRLKPTYMDDALSIVVPSLFRLTGLSIERTFTDSLSFTSSFGINMNAPLYSYYDVYGINYGKDMNIFDVYFTKNLDEKSLANKSILCYLSHSPKVLIDDPNLTRIMWNNFNDLNGFERIFFDNNLLANIQSDMDHKGRIIKRLTYGYSRCIHLIGYLPQIIKEAISLEIEKASCFSEAFHIVLKAAIGYAPHITGRVYNKLRGMFDDKTEILGLAPTSNSTECSQESHPIGPKGEHVFKLIANGQSFKYAQIDWIE